MYVSYLYWDSKFDEWVSVHPPAPHQQQQGCKDACVLGGRLAPLHTHTFNELVGGRGLRAGQRVEVLDETQTWLEAFVLQEQEDKVKLIYEATDPS